MQKLILPFTEEDYIKSKRYFTRIERLSGFCAEMALCNAFNKEWEHGYGEADIELYNAPIQVKSRLRNNNIKKLFYSLHQAKGYNRVRGFIFGEVVYDKNDKAGYFEIYPYIYAKDYVLKNSEDLIRGGRNFGSHIHEDKLATCPIKFRHEIKEEHLVGLLSRLKTKNK